jgi:hypothetical protein
MRFEPGAVVITVVDVKTGLGWGIISTEDLNGEGAGLGLTLSVH